MSFYTLVKFIFLTEFIKITKLKDFLDKTKESGEYAFGKLL
jgi:hypothetical protein